MKNFYKICQEKLHELNMNISDLKQEMISKVDIDRLTNLCKIGALNGTYRVDINRISINPMPLLNAWADSKWQFYLMFDRNLEITTHIPAVLSPSTLCNMFRKEIINKHPKYRLAFCSMSIEQVCRNQVSYRVPVPKGIMHFDRVTRLFEHLYHDKQLNADMANFYDNLDIHKDTIHISIDPYDYLTVSMNMHNWASCHNLHHGGYYSGNFAYMCDEATLVTFRDDGTPYDYNIDGIRFSGNSKQWRMLMFFDPNTQAALFTRQYPRENKQSYDAVVNLWKSSLENLNPECADMDLRMDSAFNAEYIHETNHGYPDSKYNHYNVLAMAGSLPEFHVSANYPCVSCGEIHENAHALCQKCIDILHERRVGAA